MEPKKHRWSKTYEAGEGELIALINEKNIDAERWVLEECGTVEIHSHKYATRFWCVEGSVSFTVGSKTFPLQAGDALDVPAESEFKAAAGFAGCIVYEAEPG